MEFDHSCPFCGWHRAGATPVMLAPSCERCGCALDATPAEAGPEAGAPAAMPVPARALRVTAALFGVLVMYAFVRAGYDLAGSAGAIVALGCAGFLALPFVPERIG